MINNNIKLLDAFSGIGALHKALTNLGVNVDLVGMSEIDVDAIISYGAVHNIKTDDIEIPSKEEMIKYLEDRNIGLDFKTGKCKVARLKQDKLEKVYKVCMAVNNFGDISKLDPKELPNFDLFNFSFCCQDLSVSGKQKGMKNEDGTVTRSGLYVYGIDIIRTKKPKYVMIENVKNLIGKKFINDFYGIIKEIEEVGYNCYYPKNEKDKPVCLNAKNYGVPQNRERIFVICIRKDVDNGEFEFPKEFDNGIRLKDILEDSVDDKYYMNKPFVILDKNNTNSVCNQIAKLEMKGNDCIRRVYDINYCSPTLTTCEGGHREAKALIEDRVRKLTPIECWKLMGFTKEDCLKAKEIGVSDSQLYKQAGNSIVVNVLYYIFKNLFKDYIK